MRIWGVTFFLSRLQRSPLLYCEFVRIFLLPVTIFDFALYNRSEVVSREARDPVKRAGHRFEKLPVLQSSLAVTFFQQIAVDR